MSSKLLKLIIIVGLACIYSCSSPTIEQQKTTGGNDDDILKAFCLTKDGGYIAGGISFSQKSGEKTKDNNGILYGDFWVVKYDAMENIQWDKTIGGSGTDCLKSIAVTDDGGYILAGESSSNISGEKTEACRGYSDVWVVKIDSIGNIQWDKTIGGSGTEFCDMIRQKRNGDYIITSSSNSNISGDKTQNSRGDFDMWIITLDRTGKIKSNKTIGGNNFDFCSPVEFTNDNGMIFCGFSASDKSGEKSEDNRGNFYDCWIVKFDSADNIQWDKTIGGSGSDVCRAIQQTYDGGYILAGESLSNISGEKTENCKGGWDYWVVKLDKAGNKTWDKTIGGNNDDEDVWTIQVTKDGGYIFGGKSNSNISGDKTENCRGDYDYWVVKLDTNGKIEWDKTVGGSDYEELDCIRETQKNHFILAGTSRSAISGDKTEPSRGKKDFWIVHLK